MKKTLKNTLENKAKFFAQYIWQKVYTHIDYDGEIRILDSLFLDPKGSYTGSWLSDGYYLELQPLSRITDEDAIEIAKIMTFHDGKGIIIERKKNGEIEMYDRYNDEPHFLNTLFLVPNPFDIFSRDDNRNWFQYDAERIIEACDYLRGRIYVHASKINFKDFDVLMSLPDRQRKVFNDFIKTNKFNSAIGSAIIGEVDIVDCVINHESIWAEKTEGVTAGNQFFYKKPIWNWVLANPVLYEKPIPAKGKLSFWEPDFEIVECIGCSGKFNHEEMSQDDADENYCPECWSHFKPILKAEYDELKANGEID